MSREHLNITGCVIRTAFICFLFSFFMHVHAQEAYPGILSKAREKRDPIYVLDTNYSYKGTYPFVLDDLKIGERILLHKISNETILKFHIKSVVLAREYTDGFDKNGNINYEKWVGPFCGSTFEYEYDHNNSPLSIAIKDTNNNYIIGTAKYKYTATGRLLQAGYYIFKYYPGGLLKSIEDGTEIERYGYDRFRNLNHINFDIKPGINYCGNRTDEWKGVYNEKKQLIKEEIIGFPDSWIRYFQYDSAGIIIKSITQNEGFDEDSTTEYIYTNGLLTEKITSSKGKVSHTEKYSYQFY